MLVLRYRTVWAGSSDSKSEVTAKDKLSDRSTATRPARRPPSRRCSPEITCPSSTRHPNGMGEARVTAGWVAQGMAWAWVAIRAAVAHTGSPPARSGCRSKKSTRPSRAAKKISFSTTTHLQEGRAHMGHRADARGSMGWQRGEVAIIYRQKLPSSAFFGVGGATPGFFVV